MSIGVTISIILWIVTVMGFIVWNLYQKNKKMEQIIEVQSFYIQSINSLSSDLDTVANKIDSTMWVQSDPELIQLFDGIKSLNSAIKRFTSVDGN
jgi:hypothetical protein